jgi:mono/diheme cytochrome c family protein/glucose/arabinose dehydrogenase
MFQIVKAFFKACQIQYGRLTEGALLNPKIPSCSMSITRCIPYFFIVMILASCAKNTKEDPSRLSPARTAAEEFETFQLEPGFELQLVASEPMVEDPVYITFDEDGRLWVVEMRGFMTDTLGSEEGKPIGRISILEDTDQDGMMDKSTIYLDSLIMPRALGFFADGVLVSENLSLWVTKDLDGDLKADLKVLLDSTYASSGNPEHSDNGLLRNMDNWYYNAKSSLRYKYQDKTWIRDSTEFRGQYGITSDDQGRLYYNYNWSQLHGDLVPPNYLSRNANHTPTTGIDHGVSTERAVYPIHPTSAVNRGYIQGVLDENQTLLEFTAACSPYIYRSTLFPKEYYGNAFVAEPAGNLVRRNVLTQQGTQVEARNPSPGKEFLASTDDRFRPTSFATGPDGALYIADMYRGLIQHGEYLTPYLIEESEKKGLFSPVHLGRIWRVVPTGFSPKSTVKLSTASNTTLLGLLADENGWNRDMAQRLLVERNDQSVIPELEKVIRDDSKGELARVHALWTLEGLQALSEELLISVSKTSSPFLKNTAIRLLEAGVIGRRFSKEKFAEVLTEASQIDNEQIALQVALSSYPLYAKEERVILKTVFNKYGEDALIRDAILSSLENREYAMLTELWDSPDWKNSDQKKEIFLESLVSAVMKRGNSDETIKLLAMANSKDKEFGWKESNVISTMSLLAVTLKDRKPIPLPSSPDIFQRTNLPIADTRVDMLKRMFSWPGYSPEKVALPANQLDEKSLEQFALGRQKFLATCAGCHGTNGKGASRMGPPLVDSEWVLGDEIRLSMILLHGLEGPVVVNGKTYDAPEILPVMPSHATMSDGDIAAILTYIRNEWGNQAAPVSKDMISKTRITNQGRVFPWKSDELNEHLKTISDDSSK